MNRKASAQCIGQATRKYRGIVFARMHRREIIEYAAVLDPADEDKRVAIRVHKRSKGKDSWIYRVVGNGISETGVSEFLNDALDAATKIALARLPIKTQSRNRLAVTDNHFPEISKMVGRKPPASNQEA
jgi:hypothetical protein